MRALMFRHAERENSGSQNPPLSHRGLKQAVKLVEEIRSGRLPLPDRMYCSPKLRAHQTFHQVRLQLKSEMFSHNDLDERMNSESLEQFSKRVQRFLQMVEGQTGVVYFVTHMDWLEEAVQKIHSNVDLLQERFRMWAPAQSIEFDVHDGLWTFQNLRQTEV